MDEQPITTDETYAPRAAPETSETPETPETPDAPDSEERRIFGRIKPYWLQCNLGYVLDISAHGIKILSKRKLSGYVSLRLWDERLGANLQAEVVWARKIKFRQVETGLKFIDLGPEVAQTLAVIAANFHG